MSSDPDHPDAQTDDTQASESANFVTSYSADDTTVAPTSEQKMRLGAVIDRQDRDGFDTWGSADRGAEFEEGLSRGTKSESAGVDAKLLSCVSANKEEESQDSPIARPAVSVYSDSYDMNHKNLGYALIINQEQFSPQLRAQGYSRRTGTAVDERNINRRLRRLGFNVTSYPDLTGNQMKNLCKKMADKDHSECDCFVCVILSHGEEGIVYGTDKAVHIKELSDFFKADQCPSLAGKPKLFIIQACRGYQTDPGVKVTVGSPQDEVDARVIADQTIKLPIEADFLFAYSTVPGYYSWRNGANGSWFIQALCDCLEKMGETIEIRRLLTIVNRKVAHDFQSYNPGNEPFHKMKQVPCITSMLTKDLFLSKKKRRH